MKRLLLTTALFFLFAGFCARAQHPASKDSSATQSPSVASVLGSTKDIEKRAGLAQGGLDTLKKLSSGKIQKKLGSLSKGLSNIMKAEKSVSKVGDDPNTTKK